MMASGVAQIQQLIAKWRVPNNQTPFTTEARFRCADELEAALLAVDAPQLTETKDALTRVDSQ